MYMNYMFIPVYVVIILIHIPMVLCCTRLNSLSSALESSEASGASLLSQAEAHQLNALRQAQAVSDANHRILQLSSQIKVQDTLCDDIKVLEDKVASLQHQLEQEQSHCDHMTHNVHRLER
jgi:uncharacterized coiled-coil protein SlyX